MHIKNTLQHIRTRIGDVCVVMEQWLSPYGDGTQIGINAQGTFTLDAFCGPCMPVVTGSMRIFHGFKPKRVVVTEHISATYRTRQTKKAKHIPPEITIHEALPVAIDIGLMQSYGGSANYFPCAPNSDAAISGATLAAVSHASELDWPVINGCTDLAVAFVVYPSVLSRARFGLPDNYDSTPTCIRVRAHMDLTGPMVRRDH